MCSCWLSLWSLFCIKFVTQSVWGCRLSNVHGKLRCTRCALEVIIDSPPSPMSSPMLSSSPSDPGSVKTTAELHPPVQSSGAGELDPLLPTVPSSLHDRWRVGQAPQAAQAAVPLGRLARQWVLGSRWRRRSGESRITQVVEKHMTPIGRFGKHRVRQPYMQPYYTFIVTRNVALWECSLRRMWSCSLTRM